MTLARVPSFDPQRAVERSGEFETVRGGDGKSAADILALNLPETYTQGDGGGNGGGNQSNNGDGGIKQVAKSWRNEVKRNVVTDASSIWPRSPLEFVQGGVAFEMGSMVTENRKEYLPLLADGSLKFSSLSGAKISVDGEAFTMDKASELAQELIAGRGVGATPYRLLPEDDMGIPLEWVDQMFSGMVNVAMNQTTFGARANEQKIALGHYSI